MFSKRKSFNHKRRIAETRLPEDLSLLAKRVSYGGNPEHKRNPGDFNLNPPSNPRPDKTLCDGAQIFNRARALDLLTCGIMKGLVSTQERNSFPQNVWAVTADGIPLEAQLENSANGTYHGYPMPEQDPFRVLVLEKWNATNE